MDNPLILDGSGLTDPAGRDRNEDAVLVDPSLDLYLVADGVGGAAAGERASAMAVDVVRRGVASLVASIGPVPDPDAEPVRQCYLDGIGRVVDEASEAIYQVSQSSPTYAGMATTLVLLKRVGSVALVGHVGDSRAYLLRSGRLYQLTEDHTLGQQMVSQGLLAPGDLAGFRHARVLVRAVGLKPTVPADLLVVDLTPGDTFLLCSDGVHEVVPEKDLCRLLGAGSEEGDTARQCIEFAKSRGTRDNASAVVVRCRGRGAESVLMATDRKAAFLKNVFLFQDLTFQEILRVMRVVKETTLDTGQVLFRQGDEGHDLFLVVDGEVAVSHEGMVLTLIGPGGHFGEMSLIGEPIRSATVKAVAPTRLLRIGRSDFEDLMRSDPGLATRLLWRFLQAMGQRLKDLSAACAAARREGGTGTPNPMC